MSKKNIAVSGAHLEVMDPEECPFREFRDNELCQELWGLGPAACRLVAFQILNKTATKPAIDLVWADSQTQPLPRSARQYLHRWVRAEDLAIDRWESEIAVFEENEGGRMSIRDMQLTHAQVLLRSSFCRRVLSACFMLERCESLPVEHQWEQFVCSFGPEGWRAKYHIYSPGMKAGGGSQHKPAVSKSGCYLVRLFYLGAWRCVWVSDQVPVDATDAPLLPFSPMVTHTPAHAPSKSDTKSSIKQRSTMFMTNVIYLWPLLICKALLKLAAPDMTQSESEIEPEDELIPELDILHSLTGCINTVFPVTGKDRLWKLITQEVTMFVWDDDDETLASTVKSKNTKKPANKETTYAKKSSMVSLLIKDTKDCPPYALPGITPAHEMTVLCTVARDIPLKKPLPEPEVALWKYIRWVDWAKAHGLYEAYECPRTKFLKVNGLMKMSLAPHLLDVGSTESITYGFRQEQSKTTGAVTVKHKKSEGEIDTTKLTLLKEELREWVQFDNIALLTREVSVLHFPSLFNLTSAGLHPPPRLVTKGLPNRAIDIIAPKYGPLYLQIDGPEENKLRVSLSTVHPRILINSGVPIEDYIEPSYMILEKFDWFEDCALPVAKGFVQTRGYNSMEINFQPGRHYCRLWVHSRVHWHIMLISESEIIMGTRDIIQAAAVLECPWVSKFLTDLSSAFLNWIRTNRSTLNVMEYDREFFRSYQPDLPWNPKDVGYNQALLHWMFRQALQSHLSNRLGKTDYDSVIQVLRRFFRDPNLGLPPKPTPSRSLREIIKSDICDCAKLELEEMDLVEEQNYELQSVEERPLVSTTKLQQLVTSHGAEAISHVCDLATDELPCEALKKIRKSLLKKHEAATCIQAHWRGFWARKCLISPFTFTPEISKIIIENAFGNMDVLSALMNEFFRMYPGAKKAYSVSSGLSGVYGLQQHSGTSPITPVCHWVPYFQVVFYCHKPVKVHLDIQSDLANCVVNIFNNDNSQPLPQVFNAHITFDVVPNTYGYTVMGHGTLKERPGYAFDAHWMLTILTSVDSAFHVCDNDPAFCTELPFQAAYKMHINEIFLPNRRNILGGILVSVTKHECITFKATSTSPDLEMVATLKIISPEGDGPEIMKCEGKGEIFWPFIRLTPNPPVDLQTSTVIKKKSHIVPSSILSGVSSTRSLKQLKQAKTSPVKTNKSLTKLMKDPKILSSEPRLYSIEVTVPSGWPLTLQRWRRVDEIRQGLGAIILEPPSKKQSKPPSSRSDRISSTGASTTVPEYQPLPDDAYVELECSIGVSANALAKRDDTRDVKFATARKTWEVEEPGRNLRGEMIRAEFLAEFLEVPASSPSEKSFNLEENFEETEEKLSEQTIQHGPSPVTESTVNMSMEAEEESVYLTKPEQICPKFIPLAFLPLCMKERNDEESALLTNDMAEAAMRERHTRIEAAGDRMKELQHFNETYVIQRQRKRCHLLDKVFVDAQYCDEVMEKIEERDDAIALETLTRTLSANKKKEKPIKK